LLVEDNDDNRTMYRHYLEWEGFRIAEAADGLEAIAQAAALMPAAIVMDLTLPRLDGWHATRRIRADSRTRHIPVLALTAHAFAGAAEQATAAGCDGYLAKPCLPDALARAIRRIIGATDRNDRDRRRDQLNRGQSPAAGRPSRQGRPATSGARRGTRSRTMGAARRGGGTPSGNGWGTIGSVAQSETIPGSQTPDRPLIVCLRCKQPISAGTGYDHDGKPAHLRCDRQQQGTPDSLVDAVRFPARGKPAWDDSYLVVDGRLWHLGRTPDIANRRRKGRRQPGRASV
jgi:CheY-like chemotaxis protein